MAGAARLRPLAAPGTRVAYVIQRPLSRSAAAQTPPGGDRHE